MTKKGWIVVVIIIAVLVGAFFLWSSNANAPTVDEGAASDAMSDALAQSTAGSDAMDDLGAAQQDGKGGDGPGLVGTAPMTATVTYNGNSFSPANVTIAEGGTVTFTDTAGATMWVASNVHPSHADYYSTSRSEHCATGYTGAKPFDQCGSGASYSFTFDKAGSIAYHDHMNASAGGMITVVAQ